MKLLPASLLLSAALLAVDAADVLCPAGKSSSRVVLKAGESASFSTQDGDSYGANTNCVAVFTRARKQKCQLSFSCAAFQLTAANAKCTKKSDFFKTSATGKTKFCDAAGPDVTTTKGSLKVQFRSHKKSRGNTGAVCTASCLEEGATTQAVTEVPVTTETPVITTEAPVITTVDPATAATAIPTTAALACMNCTSTDGRPCQFPFYVNGQEYSTCTLDYTSPGEDPWCATKVDGQGSWLHSQGDSSYGYCSSDCPTGVVAEAPACPFRENGFPASCAERQASTNKNILFLGNSYTYGNNLKGMVQGLAQGAGFSATVDENSAGGVTLEWHVANSLAKIRGGDWDVVVLQDQSQRPSFGSGYVYGTIMPDVTTIVTAIRETNPCTVPLFFQTWGKKDGDAGNCANGATALCTFEGVQDQLSQAYSAFAYENQPAKVAPAGEAWRTYSNRNSLFSGDGSHATMSGTFLAACTMFEQIWGVPSTTSTYSPVGDSAALKIQATTTVSQEAWSHPSSGPRCPSPAPPSWQCA